MRGAIYSACALVLLLLGSVAVDSPVASASALRLAQTGSTSPTGSTTGQNPDHTGGSTGRDSGATGHESGGDQDTNQTGQESDQDAERAREDAERRAREGNSGNSDENGTDQERDEDELRAPTHEDTVPGSIHDLGTVSAPPPTPPVAAHAPRGEPPHGPLITQMEDCSWARAGGWLQPVQGVYQDDPRFPKVLYDGTGKPRPNPQIEEIGLASYMAWLPMIVGRDTVVMGVERYRSKSGIVRGASHSEIVIKGWSNCFHSVGVKIQFKLLDESGTRVIYTTPVVGFFPLKGPALRDGQVKTITYTATDGLPPADVGPFQIHGNDYFLTAELVREDDSPTGIFVSVGGPSVVTHPPVVKFVPAILNTGTMSDRELADFRSFAQEVAEGARQFIPDYYPLVPDGLPTFAVGPMALADLDPHEHYNFLNQQKFAAKLADRVGTAAMLGGADRVVVLLRAATSTGSDYTRVAGEGTAGETISTKVIFVRADPASAEGGTPPLESGNGRGGDGVPPIIQTIAHEIVHTMPHALWSASVPANIKSYLEKTGMQLDHDMRKDCGRDYHNEELRIAFGEQIDTGGYATQRHRRDGSDTIMGPSFVDEHHIKVKSDNWITQCTYGHLIWSMLIKPDPKLFLVRAIVSRAGGKASAELMPGYDLEGVSDLNAGATKGWAVRLLDAQGSAIATYPFDPVWQTEMGTRDIAPVALRVPADDRAAMLQIVFNSNAVASRAISAKPPALRIGAAIRTAPDKVHLAWSSGDGAPLLASVLYSSNGGKWFDERVFEKDVSEADIAVDPDDKDPVIRITVTDGSRSTQTDVHPGGATP